MTKIPNGCQAKLTNICGKRVWLITTSVGGTFVAREVSHREWWAWTSLQAMREGVTRVHSDASRLFDLIAFLDVPGSPARKQLMERTA